MCLFISCCQLDLRAKREEDKLCKFGWWTLFKTILPQPAASVALQPVFSVGIGGISSLLTQRRNLSYLQQNPSVLSSFPLQKSLCSTHLSPTRHAALMLPSPLLLLPPHISMGLQIWDAGLSSLPFPSPPLPSCDGFIPVQLWMLGWHRGWQREGELVPSWQDKPWWQWSNSAVWQVWNQAGRGEGEMINESQKCCSQCTGGATGLWSRSGNLTPWYVQAVSLKAGSSSLALWQPESSQGSWCSHSHYFVTCQRKACGKRHMDFPVLCSSFSPIYILRNRVQTGAASSSEPTATGSQAQILHGPSQALVIGLKTQIGGNWEDFGFFWG